MFWKGYIYLFRSENKSKFSIELVWQFKDLQLRLTNHSRTTRKANFCTRSKLRFCFCPLVLHLYRWGSRRTASIKVCQQHLRIYWHLLPSIKWFVFHIILFFFPSYAHIHSNVIIISFLDDIFSYNILSEHNQMLPLKIKKILVT